MSKDLVIIDRDGVINSIELGPVYSPTRWTALPGSLEAIARLTQAGLKVAVVTNQPGVSTGEIDLNTLHAIHDKMRYELARHRGRIDCVFFCPHQDSDACVCRKPNTGLFDQVAQSFDVTLTSTPIIGDSQADIQAALNLGAMPILVQTGHGHETQAALTNNKVMVRKDLSEAVDTLLH